MTDEQHGIEPLEVVATLIGPGHRLKKARLAKGKSAEDVAKQLCLTVDLIERLEKDDYSKAPRLVFLKGYLRNYAKLVQLSESEIIHDLNRMGIEENLKIHDISRDVIARSPRSVGDRSKPWAAASLILVVMLVGVFWWQHEAAPARPENPKIATLTHSESKVQQRNSSATDMNQTENNPVATISDNFATDSDHHDDISQNNANAGELEAANNTDINANGYSVALNAGNSLSDQTTLNHASLQTGAADENAEANDALTTANDGSDQPTHTVETLSTNDDSNKVAAPANTTAAATSANQIKSDANATMTANSQSADPNSANSEPKPARAWSNSSKNKSATKEKDHQQRTGFSLRNLFS